MIEFVDTHCHIHAAGRGPEEGDFTAKKWAEAGETDPKELQKSAVHGGVTRLICAGTDLADSKRALEFAKGHGDVWASAGVHPHEAKLFWENKENLAEFEQLLHHRTDKLVAIGECGLDYYYEHSPKKQQIELLEWHLDLAKKHNLPVIFHVREAYEDFWPIIDNFKDIRGVVHSFSATTRELDQALKRGFYVGINGIMTFTKESAQLQMAKALPIEKLMLETDAPYLTPSPLRGKVCKPEHLKLTAQFLAELRGESIEQLARQTTTNARRLFNLG